MSFSIDAGDMMTLEVVRKADFGYFLSNGEEDVLLHNNEITEDLEIGSEVEVFIYQDHKGRNAATMKKPKITTLHYDFVEVAAIQERLGVFVNIGIQKDMLISFEDLPRDTKKWPQVGDQLFCGLKCNKKGRLFAMIATENVIEYERKDATEELFNETLKGNVYRMLDDGALLLTEDRYVAFIYKDDQTHPLRLGEEVTFRVSFVKENGKVNGSMRPRKEVSYVQDSERIFQYLKERQQMPYTDKTSPEIIKEKFQMSKAAFKRALGKLMKENKIEQKDGWTRLKE